VLLEQNKLNSCEEIFDGVLILLRKSSEVGYMTEKHHQFSKASKFKYKRTQS